MSGSGRLTVETPSLTVRSVRGYRLTLAARDFAPGEAVFEVAGRLLPRPTRLTVQVAADRHVLCRQGRYVNHSCRPNCRFDAAAAAFRATRAIAAGEELTFDYNSTEYDLRCPFRCRCGAADCVGRVRGYRHLPPERRRRLAPLAAAHLLRLAGAER